MALTTHQVYLAGYLADAYAGSDLVTVQAVEEQRGAVGQSTSNTMAYALGLRDRARSAPMQAQAALTAALSALFTGPADPLNVFYDSYARSFAAVVMASSRAPVQLAAPAAAPGASAALAGFSIAQIFTIARGLGQVDGSTGSAPRDIAAIVAEIRRVTA